MTDLLSALLTIAVCSVLVAVGAGTVAAESFVSARFASAQRGLAVRAGVSTAVVLAGSVALSALSFCLIPIISQ